MTAMIRFLTSLHLLNFSVPDMAPRPAAARGDRARRAGGADLLRAGQAPPPVPMVMTAAFGGRTFASTSRAGLAKGRS
jgi:hypothetical protein